MKQEKPIELCKASGDLNKAMAILDEITLNVIQKELAVSNPDTAWYKSYEQAAHDIKKRVDCRHNVLHQPVISAITSNNKER